MSFFSVLKDTTRQLIYGTRTADIKEGCSTTQEDVIRVRYGGTIYRVKVSVTEDRLDKETPCWYIR